MLLLCFLVGIELASQFANKKLFKGGEGRTVISTQHAFLNYHEEYLKIMQ